MHEALSGLRPVSRSLAKYREGTIAQQPLGPLPIAGPRILASLLLRLPEPGHRHHGGLRVLPHDKVAPQERSRGAAQSHGRGSPEPSEPSRPDSAGNGRGPELDLGGAGDQEPARHFRLHVTIPEFESLLARYEGVRRFAYDDATGKPVRPGTTVRGAKSPLVTCPPGHRPDPRPGPSTDSNWPELPRISDPIRFSP